jgi:hypothetical protein
MIREWIAYEIRRGSTSQQILMRAAKALFQNQQVMGFGSRNPNRDHYITHNDIANIKRIIDKETWMRHDDDATSTEMWIEASPYLVLLYTPPSSDPYSSFRLVFQRQMQLEWLLQYGNGGCVCIDGTAGMNKYKVLFKLLFTCVCDLYFFISC